MSVMQYVVFSLGKEEYGIDISFAQEIIRIPQQIMKIPNVPSYVEGLANLRGKVIPVVDLKKRFGFEETLRSEDSRLLVLNFGDSVIGSIVDDVSEVIKIDDQSIEILTDELATIGGNSIKGIGKVNDHMILLLDAEKMKSEVFQVN